MKLTSCSLPPEQMLMEFILSTTLSASALTWWAGIIVMFLELSFLLLKALISLTEIPLSTLDIITTR